MVLCTGLRVWTALHNPNYTFLTHHYATHLRMDGLMFGVAISYLYHYENGPLVRFLTRFRPWVFWLSVALISPIFIYALGSHPFLSTYGFTMLYVGDGGLILLAITAKPGDVPFSSNRWVVAIGRESYSIYLWHLEVVFHVWPTLEAALPRSEGTTRLFADQLFRMGGALLFGRLMTLLVEKPFLRLRERLLPARKASPSPAAGTAQPAVAGC